MKITENAVVFQRHSGPLRSKTASIVGFSRRKKKIIPICWYLWSERASGGREQENSLLGLLAGGASRLGFGLRVRRRGGKPSPGSLLALGPHPVFGSFRGRKGWRGIRCAFRNPGPPLAFRQKFLRNGSRSCWQGCARLREESAPEFNTIRDPRLEFKLRKTA